MLEPVVLSVLFFLLVMLMVYLRTSQRNLIKNRALTHEDYLWKLKQISGKSEYELFHIAAEEKGWPEYQVERHFKRYLENQTLPSYVKEFLEDGKEYIDTYRPNRGEYLNKRVLIFYSLFALLIIGGSFVFCLYIYPRIYQYDFPGDKAIPKLARLHIFKAISFAHNRQYEKACSELKEACDSGYCEAYDLKRREKVCQ